MRSRYAAYALSKADYIIHTTHPQSPYFEKDTAKWKKVILEFCRTTRFLKLEILEFGEDWVHFIAHLSPISLNERSHFEKINGKWLYVRGLIKDFL